MPLHLGRHEPTSGRARTHPTADAVGLQGSGWENVSSKSLPRLQRLPVQHGISIQLLSHQDVQVQETSLSNLPLAQLLAPKEHN